MKLSLNLVEQVEWVASFAVHLVHKHDDRSLAHAADGHQLAGLGLHTFCTVNHDDCGIHGGQRSERVLSKVLVTGSVQDIHLIVLVVELHH